MKSISKKGYSFNFNFAGSGGIAGSMICVCCNTKIDSEKEDYVDYMINTKHDWKYQTKHRKCVSDHSGWALIEKKEEQFKNDVAINVDKLKSFQDENGDFTNAFFEAAEQLGLNIEYS